MNPQYYHMSARRDCRLQAKQPAFFLLSLLLLLFSSCVTEEDPDPLSLTPGDRCPSFTVALADGTAVSTADLAGHTTLLLFFDTTCSDCRSLLPVVQQVYTTLGSPTIPGAGSADIPGAGFTPVDAEVSGEPDDSRLVLAISRAQAAPAVLEYWEANSLTIPVSPQPDRTVYDLFANTLIPRVYIISPSLTITHTYADSPLPTAALLLAAMGGK